MRQDHFHLIHEMRSENPEVFRAVREKWAAREIEAAVNIQDMKSPILEHAPQGLISYLEIAGGMKEGMEDEEGFVFCNPPSIHYWAKHDYWHPRQQVSKKAMALNTFTPDGTLFVRLGDWAVDALIYTIAFKPNEPGYTLCIGNGDFITIPHTLSQFFELYIQGELLSLY